MKKVELFFTALRVPVDYVMVLLAGIVAYNLRFAPFVTEIRPVFYDIVFQDFFRITVVVGLIFLAIFVLAGLYATRVTARRLDELARVFLACTASITVIVLVIFFQRELFSSRFIILSGWILSVVFVSAGRLIIDGIQNALRTRGVGAHAVVIFGNDRITDDLASLLYKNPRYGYKIVERWNTIDKDALLSFENLAKQREVDEAIMADPNFSKQQMQDLKQFCDANHIAFKYATDLFETQTTHIEINTIADIPIIEVRRTKLDGWGRIMKRLFDVFTSFILLVISSPLLFLLAMIILIDSQGPVLVRLDRVGEKGRQFVLFKFRSMIKDAHTLKKQLVNLNERADGPLFKIRNDPRITRFGRVLRKFSLDELPQLLNVLKGDMSLVGPRPHEPEEVSRYSKHQRRLLTIKPGMTGFAQVSGRSDLKFEDEAKLDIYYIENWSLAFDLQILLKTPGIVLSGRSAA